MIPYVDSGTFERAPTGLDLSQLVIGGTAQDQAAELTNVLLRASRWVDSITQQRYGLAASTNQDPPKRVRAQRDGTVLYSPLTFPIVSIVSGNWWWLWPGSVPTVNAINTEMVTVLDRKILLADTTEYRYSRGWGARPLFVQLSYENGYAHTTLADNASADTTTITVASTIGITGTASGLTTANVTPYVTILDGQYREVVVVESISGNTLTLQTGTQFAHDAGAIVTAIPFDVQEWTIALATELIKTRDVGALAMDERGFEENSAAGHITPSLMKEAKSGLFPYTRIGGA